MKLEDLMTSAKLNKAIIKSVMDALSRADYDPSRALPGCLSTGIFASYMDKKDAREEPFQIIERLKGKSNEGLTRKQIDHFVRKEVWSHSFYFANAGITFDLAAGYSPKRNIKECREAIYALRAMGEKREADWLERSLKKAIGEP
jgi:hypothetical protein